MYLVEPELRTEAVFRWNDLLSAHVGLYARLIAQTNALHIRIAASYEKKLFIAR